ncbi:uncharacterized protein Z518_04241 [Rhinocladiella mackenziei CBS 650.93]|uniref:Rhinocladiella mackenziei CBS 650.93 unplaced genomic scaffold supercont1.3, whole genome shotgun sequence n=1 Tax=Rhinocladiella mackenziei CBS 650.93 TaxID=1442369 RepID=A0A0D2ISV6_9EURO|nr:uncharacterized protein Z518_04241 [Rhinocladiella mackenziei CBS 650.93]KIX06266.1 hypothetical protein Z518_04241 [Rhinocladiella mackenziei CBS 650.93]
MPSEGKPAYGRRLMPSVLDELAKKNPNRLYAAIPKTTNVTEGFRDVTVADIARCANFMAQRIERRFGRSERFETLSYIGIPDLRGAIIFQAALLLPSPRNPPSTNISLMNQTASTKLLHTVEVAPIVKQLQDLEPGIRNEVIPSFEEMMNSTPEHYPYEKGFDEARNDPVVVLHSSGSTAGLPKPITMTHGSFAVLDNTHNLPEVSGRKKRDWSMWTFDGEARVYTIFPFFHLAGFLSLTLQTIFMNASPVLGPPHMIPDGPLLKGVMFHQKLRSIFLPPAVIEQLLHEPDGIQFFKDLEFLVYSGAPFNPVIGDQLSKVVELVSPFGSTEVFPQPELAVAREDWAWHEFNPHIKHEMQVYDPAEGTFELVIYADESTQDTAAAYHNLPGVTEYRTKDLFTQHPEKPRLFKYYGRRDDIIVLANGEKFNPIPLEVNVQDHPSLKGAFVVGNGRTQGTLLVEPKEPADEAGRTKLLEELWPLIEKSNSLVAGQGRIHRGKVICALPEKPFTRTSKGTIVRKLTEEAYKDEIEELYSGRSSQERIVCVSLKPSLKPVYELSTIVDFLRNILAASFAAGATIGEDEDFFAYGLDSVQTLEIVSHLKRNLETQTSRSMAWISPRSIFRHSSIADLARLLKAFLDEGTVPEEDSDLARAREVDEIVAKYVKTLPKKPASQTAQSSKMSAVALIGSTGYLGSHVVANLLKNSDVSRVYCLNRAGDAQKRQEIALNQLDESVRPLLHKLEYMTVKLGQPSFGLARHEYGKIANEVDVIVYNSWRLDFGLAIRSFSPFLRTTRDLVDLAAAGNRTMRIVFVSSVSSVGSMAKKTTVPEAPVQDPLAAFNFGYAQSKLAAEQILTSASQHSGVSVSIVRLCQVGGPASGNTSKWADQPWISALARTAKTLKLIPSNVASIDWVPVDTIASMLQDFILHPASRECQFYHIRHPRPESWELLVSILRETFGVTETVPLREWVKKLRDITDPNAEDLAKMPALKMLDFYEALGDGIDGTAYAIDHALSGSQVKFPTVDKQMLESWLQGWNLKA